MEDLGDLNIHSAELFQRHELSTHLVLGTVLIFQEQCVKKTIKALGRLRQKDSSSRLV
jgi:hypothetical protein